MSINLNQVLDELEQSFYETYWVNTSDELVNSYIEQEKDAMEKARNSIELKSLIDKIKNNDLDEEDILLAFISDIKNAFSNIKEKNYDFKCQIIFLEYDYEPVMHIQGYSEGDYPLLNKPEYFKFNYQEGYFFRENSIDLSGIWKNLIELRDLLDDFNLDIMDSEFYQAISDFYKYKAFYLLHKAFDIIGSKLFNEIDISLPLYIYGNEHDCEAMNIYIFE